MNKPPLFPFLLAATAQKTGVSPACISQITITKVYRKNTYNPGDLYRQTWEDGSYPENEAAIIIDCIAVEIAEDIKNKRLNLANRFGFSKTSYNVSQS
jgi:hypothetical protein